MKFAYRIILILVLCLSGCSKDHHGEITPPHSISILFNFNDEEGNDIFGEEIQNVTVILFDKEGHYLSHKYLSKTELEDFKGVLFYPQDDDYQLIFWGNRSDNMEISISGEGAVFENFRIGHKDKSGNDVRNGAPLFYASLQTSDLETPEKAEISFTRAHKLINIYVKGFVDEVDGTNLLPVIRFTGVPTGYDFTMSPLTDLINYKQSATNILTPEGYLAGVSYYTPHFTDGYDSEIHIIKASTGESAYTFSLRELLEKKASPEHEYIISVFIEFNAGEVSITLPEWSETGVHPEI